jgi:hypothetical protein
VRTAGLWLAVAAALLASCSSTPGQASRSWNHYHSEKWGYSIEYPPGWFELPNYGAPDTEKYFGNEKDMGSPISIDARAVLLSLSTLTAGCRVTPTGNIDGTARLKVNGQTVTRVTGFLGGSQSEAYWSSQASIPNGTVCFGFAFVFGNKSTRDANLPITDQLITSFTTS